MRLLRKPAVFFGLQETTRSLKIRRVRPLPRNMNLLIIAARIHLKLCGFFDGDGGREGTAANALPCLPATGAWHAPVTAPTEEQSSDSSAERRAGQGIPAAPVPVLLR